MQWRQFWWQSRVEWCHIFPYWFTTSSLKDLRPVVACLQYIPRNMHTVSALLGFVVVIHWLIFPYPSGLLHWHCGNLTIAPVPAKRPWWIWINTSCEFIMNDCITTTKQSTTKPCAYFLGYTVHTVIMPNRLSNPDIMYSTLLIVCARNTSATTGFPQLRSSNDDLNVAFP